MFVNHFTKMVVKLIVKKLFRRMLLVSRGGTHVQVPPSGGAAGGEDRVVAKPTPVVR